MAPRDQPDKQQDQATQLTSLDSAKGTLAHQCLTCNSSHSPHLSCAGSPWYIVLDTSYLCKLNDGTLDVSLSLHVFSMLCIVLLLGEILTVVLASLAVMGSSIAQSLLD